MITVFLLFGCGALCISSVRGHSINLQLKLENEGGKTGNLCLERGKVDHSHPVHAVQQNCTADLFGTLRLQNKDLEFCDGKRWRKVLSTEQNTPDKPGSSCRQIKNNHNGLPSLQSGVYWLDPNGGSHGDAFKAYCDMTSFGGGWTMCYTTDNLVKMKTEVNSPGINFGENGYRSDCNNIPFTEIMFVDEANDQRAYFSRSSGGALVTSGNYGQQANAFGLWNGNGVANTGYQYQLNICDHSFYSGFMITGFTNNCYKQCNSWCGDKSSDFYRAASTHSEYAGVAFKENGHSPVHVS